MDEKTDETQTMPVPVTPVPEGGIQALVPIAQAEAETILQKKEGVGFWAVGNLRAKRGLLKVMVEFPTTSLRQAANVLGVSRMTVLKWYKDEAFQKEMVERREAYNLLRRARREAETEAITDTLAQKAIKSLIDGDEEAKPGKLALLLNQYRAFRGEERLDTGEATSRSEANLNIAGSLKLDENHTTRQSFLTLIQQNITAGEVVGKDPEKAIVDVVGKLMADTDLLTRLHKEDDLIEAAEIEEYERTR